MRNFLLGTFFGLLISPLVAGFVIGATGELDKELEKQKSDHKIHTQRTANRFS